MADYVGVDVQDRTCMQCGEPLRTKSARKYCSVTCSNRATNAIKAARTGGGRDPDVRRASYRAKNYRRRAGLRAACDVTAEYERLLRTKTKRCPMPRCGVKLTDEPARPNSRELDHIIPVNAGGTHTIGNVRVICRACNLRRPKDGSDYEGPVTLWAQDRCAAPSRTPAGLCPCGTRKVRGRCCSCRPRQEPDRRTGDGRRAAELRADGWSWTDIARELNISHSHNAGKLARKYGKPDVIERWPRPITGCRQCGTKLPTGGRGRPRTYCTTCRPAALTAQNIQRQAA